MDTVPQIVAHCAGEFALRVALREHGSDAPAWTYERMGVAAAVVAERLASLGAGRGEPAALLAENSPGWVLAHLGVLAAGAVCVPLDTKLTAAELRGILRASRARLLIASRSLGRVAADAVDGAEGVRLVPLDELLAELPQRPAGRDIAAATGEIDGDDPAVISFTSGTTGDSKGIVLTHRNIASNAAAGADRMGVVASDRLLSVLPLHHLFEQTAGLLVPLISGASITYCRSLSPRTIAAVMRDSGTTIVMVVPALARLLHKRIRSEIDGRPAGRRAAFRAARAVARLGGKLRLPVRRRLFRSVHEAFGGRMRFFICGGAPLDAEVARFFRDIGLPLLEGYGLSEAAPVVSSNTLGEHRLGSVGRPLPGVEVSIAPLGPADVDGEILVRGPNVMAGYHDDPQATAEAIREGWLHTGDIGRLDRAGYLYVVGRLKDVIIGESGKNVYPAEVEAAIVGSPLVREACVIGIPDPAGGEMVAVLVVCEEDALPNDDPDLRDEMLSQELRTACTGLARFKRPRRLAIWPGELPRTTTMKLRKFLIRKQAEQLQWRTL